MARLRDRPLVRFLAVVLLLGGWVVPLALPHAGEDDWLCVPLAGADSRAVSMVAASSADQPDHCAICHTARSLRAARAADARCAVVLLASPSIAEADAPARRAPAHDRFPARAPPSPFLTLS